MPQTVGMCGAPEMLKVSLLQVPLSPCATPATLPSPPKKSPMEVETVDGPVMTKVSKSNLIWQMFVVAGQICALH